MNKLRFAHGYDHIIFIENLLAAWREFIRKKRNKKDVLEFQLHLMDNILDLHADLGNRIYVHGPYHAFNINDPKPRNIHKASVRDRLLHHAIHRTLYPFFDGKFISDSFSSRRWKGTHKAIMRFRKFARKTSKNNSRTCWVLKCDIRKFFASIDHDILLKILHTWITDTDVIALLENIIRSFGSTRTGVGLPLGNLTSQLLVNIYMNEFDQWVKHVMKIQYYIRYADDFVIFDTDKDKLLELIPKLADFLEENLNLTLHPDKVFVKTLASGVDFLGWIHFPDHRVLRSTTKRRMFRRIAETKGKPETARSYLGLLKHGDAHKLAISILL